MSILGALRRVVGVLALGLATTHVMAEDANDEAVLLISGLTKEHSMSVNDLREIGETTYETSTIWTEGIQSFTGVLLSDLLAHLDVTDGMMIATAINDYQIEFPVEDALEVGPMVAFFRNGERMSVREKGPLWIVYPYDTGPEFQTEIVHARSIWQLNRVSFETE